MITILSCYKMRDLIFCLTSSELNVFNVILLMSRCFFVDITSSSLESLFSHLENMRNKVSQVSKDSLSESNATRELCNTFVAVGSQITTKAKSSLTLISLIPC